MATAMDAEAERRFLWTGFAGFMLMVSGSLTVVQGLWALDHEDDAAARAAATQLSFGSLEFWGWVAITWGVIAFVTSFAVFTGKSWARWLGIAAAAISLVLAFFWVFAFPIAAFAIMFIDALVIYALFVHGRSPERTA